MSKHWMGSPPEKCDFCDGDLGDRMYDARTRAGPWGTLCRACFTKHGVGLGTGKGQEYRLERDGRWLKTGG